MPTTAGADRCIRKPLVPLAAAALSLAVITGCSVDVRDPSAPEPAPSTASLATPTITPGHDADAVASQDQPFSAGGILAAGVPVGISDGLGKAPGWTVTKAKVAGASQYTKSDGCVVAASVRTHQGPLIKKDDRESTAALFSYLDPTILPEYLSTGTLRWGSDPEAPARTVEVLVLSEPRAVAGRAVVVLARVFGTADSSIYVSVSCPDEPTLAAARGDVERFLPVLPPSN